MREVKAMQAAEERELSWLDESHRMPITAVRGVAVAVSSVGREQRHIGVVYRSIDSTLKLLHLSWHHQLDQQELEELDSPYLWGEPAVHPMLAPVLSMLCEVIAEKYGPGSNRKLAYALKYSDGRFDEQGEFVTSDGHGLTCATFVMALFKSAGVTLVKQEEWLPRDGDKIWQEHIIKVMRKREGASPGIQEHIEILQTEVGCVRFRPEEVAASGLAERLPVGFEFAQRVGQKIVERLEARQRAPGSRGP